MAERAVIRKKDLPKRLAMGRTAIDGLIAAGELRVFPLTAGGRAKVAFEDEIVAFLERRAAEAKAKS